MAQGCTSGQAMAPWSQPERWSRKACDERSQEKEREAHQDGSAIVLPEERWRNAQQAKGEEIEGRERQGAPQPLGPRPVPLDRDVGSIGHALDARAFIVAECIPLDDVENRDGGKEERRGDDPLEGEDSHRGGALQTALPAGIKRLVFEFVGKSFVFGKGIGIVAPRKGLRSETGGAPVVLGAGAQSFEYARGVLAAAHGHASGTRDFEDGVSGFAQHLDETFDLAGAAGHFQHDGFGGEIHHARAEDRSELKDLAARVQPMRRVGTGRDLDEAELADHGFGAVDLVDIDRCLSL